MSKNDDLNVNIDKEIEKFRTKRRAIRFGYYMIIFSLLVLIQIISISEVFFVVFIMIILFGISIYAGTDINSIRLYDPTGTYTSKDINLKINELIKIKKIIDDSKKSHSNYTLFGIILAFAILGLISLIIIGLMFSINFLVYPVSLIFLDIIITSLGLSIGYLSTAAVFGSRFKLPKGPSFLYEFYKNYLYNYNNLQFVTKINYFGDYFSIKDFKLMITNPDLREQGLIGVLFQVSVSQITYPYCVLVLNKKHESFLKNNYDKSHKRIRACKWPIIYESPYSHDESVLVVRLDIPSKTTTVPYITISHLHQLFLSTLDVVRNLYGDEAVIELKSKI